MSTDQTAGPSAPLSAETLEAALLDHLEERTNSRPAPDQDLFGSGLVSSMFAMQLIVHLEKEYGIRIVGKDLRLDNFRTARTMSALVLRLRAEMAAGGGGTGHA